MRTAAINFSLSVLCVLCGELFAPPSSAEPIPVSALNRTNVVDFAREIAPILRDNCQACHNASKAKAGLSLETPASILKGGESGPAVVPGKSNESLLLKSASHTLEPFMPPSGNQAGAKNLTSEQLGLVKLWIDQGATGTVGLALAPLKWKELPATFHPINAVALSPDGQFAACGRGGRLAIYRLASGEEADLEAHRDVVQSLAFSPDGGLLASGGYRAIKLWRREMPRTVKEIAKTELEARSSEEADTVLKSVSAAAAHQGEITSAALQGRFLLSGGKDGTARLWDLDKNETVRTFEQGGAVLAVAFRPDGKALLTAGENKLAKLWNAEDCKLIAELKGDRHAVERLAVAERSLSFAKEEVAFYKSSLESAEKSNQAEQEALKKARDAKEAAEKALAQAVASTNSASQGLAPARKAHESAAALARLAAQNRDAAVKLGELAAEQSRAASNHLGRITADLKEAQAGREAAVTAAIKAGAEAQAAPESAEKRKAAELAMDQAAMAKAALETALQEERSAREVLGRLADIVKQQGDAKAAGEKALAETQSIEKERLAEVQKAEKLLAENSKAVERAMAAKTKEEENVEFATKGVSKAAEAVSQAKASRAQAETGLKVAEAARAEAAKNDEAARQPIISAAFSDDSRFAATLDGSGRVAIWEARTGAALEAFQAKGTRVEFRGTELMTTHADGATLWSLGGGWKLEQTIGAEDDSSPIADRVLTLDFSPDGKWLASGGGMPSRSGEILLWSVADGSLARNFKDPHSDTVNALDFSADGKWLASGGADKFARIFEAGSGTLVRSLEGHTHHVLGVSWKRDGRTLASAGADKVLKIWNTATGEQRKTIEGFGKEVNSVHFLDGNGEALAASGDPLVRLVREDGNNNVRNFEGASDFVSSSSVTPDGRWAAAGGMDGVLRVWEGQTGKLRHSFKPAEMKSMARNSPGL